MVQACNTMATEARPAWTTPTPGAEPPADQTGGPFVPKLTLPPAGPAAHDGVPPVGSQTERVRGPHASRNGVVRRRHFATSRSRFAAKMEKRRVGATLDNMSLETEAHINRKLAEMHERDLTSVNRLAAKLRAEYDRLRVHSTSKAQEVRAVQEQLTRLERLTSEKRNSHARNLELAQARLEVCVCVCVCVCATLLGTPC